MMASHPRSSSIDLDSPDRPFDNIINFRDVGRSINRLMGKKVLNEGVLFRSARLDDASERDKRRLTDELHIATIIDLRSTSEHQMATAKLHAESGTSAPPNINTDHLFQLPHVRRQLISLAGKAFERSLLWRLDWWNFLYEYLPFLVSPPLSRCMGWMMDKTTGISNGETNEVNSKVLALAASGYRIDAVMIIGQQVMSPRGLIGLGLDMLDSSTAEMREIFELFASQNDGADRTYPVLVHCTQGKDRTGLVVLMLLLLTGVVSDEAMTADYVQSEPELVVEAEERMKEIRKLGLPEDYIKCPDWFTVEIRRHLDERYGGVDGYLRFVGVEKKKLDVIREALIA
ncbi:putative tyrosine/serine protein phosphatase [Aspergillus nomiae NRRL 13137]|uniref:Putative tyrosine/serine protein phosphatase n=1 Tax=Aspergillus nomiae NRRL (strain ATCC 15546 / NRRL 13137 / CBS 260.88 / M93) TaxID=1509407 RepID=A0A0L1J772_ASPN3|nr:putative tyrosine/serine protein phosphatase [Aspergillus nomiae NRRL 13137]KNG87263.1 putative tyrosine/serine protein phosphatase [Aspergillus nomiae NRRL 13137]